MRFVAEKFPGTWIREVEVLQNPAELSLVSMPRLQPNFYFDLVSILSLSTFLLRNHNT